ncbi:hypothetical protein [uncultured Parasphingorhabdus sp.]|uniref:hypothetical protein n=1 Tax=uncultured Parasphingorhabdus sp. TaxID=2709694 RepID=UPI0030DB18C9
MNGESVMQGISSTHWIKCRYGNTDDPGHWHCFILRFWVKVSKLFWGWGAVSKIAFLRRKIGENML